MAEGIFYRGSSHLGQPSLEEPDGALYGEEYPIEEPRNEEAEEEAVARAELSIDTLEVENA